MNLHVYAALRVRDWLNRHWVNSVNFGRLLAGSDAHAPDVTRPQWLLVRVGGVGRSLQRLAFWFVRGALCLTRRLMIVRFACLKAHVSDLEQRQVNQL